MAENICTAGINRSYLVSHMLVSRFKIRSAINLSFRLLTAISISSLHYHTLPLLPHLLRPTVSPFTQWFHPFSPFRHFSLLIRGWLLGLGISCPTVLIRCLTSKKHGCTSFGNNYQLLLRRGKPLPVPAPVPQVPPKSKPSPSVEVAILIELIIPIGSREAVGEGECECEHGNAGVVPECVASTREGEDSSEGLQRTMASACSLPPPRATQTLNLVIRVANETWARAREPPKMVDAFWFTVGSPHLLFVFIYSCGSSVLSHLTAASLTENAHGKKYPPVFWKRSWHFFRQWKIIELRYGGCASNKNLP